MAVNGFDTEDSIRAAYDAAERALGYALDNHEIFIMQLPPEQRKTLQRLAVRIVDAVMHSSERDIADMFPQLVQQTVGGSLNGRSDSVSKSA